MKTITKVRNLVILGVVVASATLSGCIIESSSSPPPVCLSSVIQAEWFITGNGATLSCAQAGATTVDLFIDGVPDHFVCDAHQGLSRDLAGGFTYDLGLRLLDSSGNILSMTQTMGQDVGCDELVDIGNVEFPLI